MDPREFLRGFFGFPRHSDIYRYRSNDFEDPDDDYDDESEMDPHSNWSDRHTREDDAFRFNVEVFTNPLEMERFFDQQLDQMLKNFGFGGRGFGGHEGLPSLMPPNGDGPIPEEHIPEPGSREFMLKDGYVLPGATKEDKDIDGHQVDSRELDKLFSSKALEDHHPIQPVNPVQPRLPFQGFFNMFPESQIQGGFSSTSERYVSLPDGSSEHHRTTRDSSGRETITVTKKSGGQTTTTTTIRNPDGSVEGPSGSADGPSGPLGGSSGPWGGPSDDGPSSIGPNYFPRPSPRDEMIASPPMDRNYSSIFKKFFGARD